MHHLMPSTGLIFAAVLTGMLSAGVGNIIQSRKEAYQRGDEQISPSRRRLVAAQMVCYGFALALLAYYADAGLWATALACGAGAARGQALVLKITSEVYFNHSRTAHGPGSARDLPDDPRVRRH